VVAHAVKAVEAFQFEHAFDPLARLVRESNHPEARAAAIRALARIDTVESAELLLGVLAHGSRADRAVAAEVLKKWQGPKFTRIARQALASAVGTEQEAVLRDILVVRGPM
jgi:hypothetical protein